MAKTRALTWTLGLLLLSSLGAAQALETPVWLDSEEQVTASPSVEADLFAPEPTPKSCYSVCLNEQIPIMCSGLSGSEYQQCVNDVAEGCRCMCGLYCP